MGQEEILARLGLALAIGLVIGLERGWRERQEVEGGRTAGLRTFALIGLSGGIWGTLLPFLGAIPFAAGFLAVAAGITLFRWREAQHDSDFGATTLIAALLTFALGAYAALGDMTVAAAAGVATTGLLAAKAMLHRWISVITWLELRATLILLAMSFVALPLLPNRDFGPYGAINPHELWLMTIAVGVVSYAGYLAVRLVGERVGSAITGLGAGLVSSTAATIDAARKASLQRGLLPFHLSAAFAASAVMFLRVLVIVGLFGPDLLPRIAVPATAATAIMAVASVVLFVWASRHHKPASGNHSAVDNPLELRSVLQFAALLAAIMMLSKWLVASFGASGASAIAAGAGLADVDAITLSVTRLSPDVLPFADAERAILVALAANSASKTTLALAIGGRMFGLPYAAVTAAAIAAGAAASMLQVVRA
jgi:uncharacterized membrane protein (DUF4010 family)